jgi:hypothetical protein
MFVLEQVVVELLNLVISSCVEMFDEENIRLMETKGSSHEVAHYKFTGTHKTSHYKLKSISSKYIKLQIISTHC